VIAAVVAILGVAGPHATAQAAARADPLIVGIVIAANQIDIGN
jgi:hypothetical protein